MARVGRILFFAAFVAVVGAASWLQFTSQRERADRASTTTASVAAVFDLGVQGENAARDYTPARNDASHGAERGAQVARSRAASDALLRSLDQRDRDARDSDGIRGLAVIVGICVLFTIVNWLLFVRTERRQAQERDRQLAFAERLQT